MNDRKILKLLRNGKHSKALDQLYKGYPTIKKLILSKGGNEEDAKDVFQEALIIFCEKAANPDFQLTAAIGTYLYSVSRFLWSDKLKKQGRTVHEFKETMSLTETTDVKDYLLEEEQYQHMDIILNQIGDKCKEILESFYFHKKDMKTIAADMGYASDKIAKNQKYKCLEKAKSMAVKSMYNTPLMQKG